MNALSSIVESPEDVYTLVSRTKGPDGKLPLTDEILRHSPSGFLFGWTQNVGMGLQPELLGKQEFLILSTHGGLRADDGSAIALGYHSGHWEVGLLVKAAAEEFKKLGSIAFAGACTDPCDGRTQGTIGMFDSLPYRNDAATIFRRLMRSLPTRSGVLGIATCDKGLPAMMMALAAEHNLPTVLVPGGVMLASDGYEDTAKVQTIGARYAAGEITLEKAAEEGCHSCASPGGGCQFLGTAATSQVVAEALGMTLPHAALAPSGQPVWLDMARRSARALSQLARRKLTTKHILTDGSVRNAITVHAAFGGSTNLLLHTPAVAFHAGLLRPGVDEWADINRKVPRIVDALPNGPVGHPTIQVFLAGGVPEVMIHLRNANLLDLNCLTVTGEALGKNLEWWEKSERRQRFRDLLFKQDGVNPDDVIMSFERAKSKGLTSSMTFPRGNLCPDGSVIKSTSIDPSVVDADGIYRKTGPAKVFVTEKAAIAAVKGQGPVKIEPGDIVVLVARGPMGSGMEEEYQLTSALKYISWGKHVAVLTDARFSGVSTGACIGHVSPEALAGGPVGKLREGDQVRIMIDRTRLIGSVDLVGDATGIHGDGWGIKELAKRSPRSDLAPDPDLPADTKLWALLQNASGGVWGGCVYDPEAIAGKLLNQ
ncbi:MAG: YjhG/YagF family D-xylonate dehydratase [Gemmataceae bacterium]|nr:YjhG/YagF family D-xylonate dehydratase [Gemmataceae bacterium]